MHKSSDGDGGGTNGILEFRDTIPAISPSIEVRAVGTRPPISPPMEIIGGGGTIP